MKKERGTKCKKEDSSRKTPKKSNKLQSSHNKNKITKKKHVDEDISMQ